MLKRHHVDRVFDNTASGAAIGNALTMRDRFGAQAQNDLFRSRTRVRFSLTFFR